MSYEQLVNIAEDMREGIETHLGLLRNPIRVISQTQTINYNPTPESISRAYGEKIQWQAKVIDGYMIPDSPLHKDLHKRIIPGFKRIEDYFRGKMAGDSLTREDFGFLISELEQLLPVAKEIEGAAISAKESSKK